MQLLRKTILSAACLLAVGSAHAQLSMLSGLATSIGAATGLSLAGKATANAGGEDTAAGALGSIANMLAEANDVDGFVRKSAELSELSSNAVTALNAAFANREQLAAKRAALAALANMSDPKQRQQGYAALYAAESAETKQMIDSGELERRMAKLDSNQKKLIGKALLNLAVGSLRAVELGKQGQSMVLAATINPLEIIRMIPIKDALPTLGRVALDATGMFSTVVKMAQAGGVAMPEVGLDTRPGKLEV